MEIPSVVHPALPNAQQATGAAPLRSSGLTSAPATVTGVPRRSLASSSRTATASRPDISTVRSSAAAKMPPHDPQDEPAKRTRTSSLRPAKTVIVVVNVLPLVFDRNEVDTTWTITWSTSATSLFYRNLVSDHEHQPLFLGCPEVFIARTEEAAVEKQLREFNCVPVFLDPTVAHRYFQGFCQGVLWPVFHNVVDVYNVAPLDLDACTENAAKRGATGAPVCASTAPDSKAAWCTPMSWHPGAQDECWGDYCSVNRTFARCIVESYHDGDIIWIHGLHFLMLPSYLLRKLRRAMIATYFHVPFPSSEIFRCLSMRTEMLRAMLCADHIGFLIFEHARHFLTSCKRLLGLNYKTNPDGMLVVEYNGRSIYVSCSHIEPDVSYLYNILDGLKPRGENTTPSESRASDMNSEQKRNIETFIHRARKKNKVIISSVDRLEGLNGLPLKLRAFDRFLRLHPERRGAVVLVQVGISLDSRPNDYHQTCNYVRQFVQEINRRWAPSESEPVVYFEEMRHTTVADRMHLWRVTDVFLDTCIRYGLSLLPFEYLVAQQRNVDHARAVDGSHQFGIMIVSEFASYSRILSGCLLVNPWKTEDIVSALVRATGMQYYEKCSRFQLNCKFLVRQSESRWTERLLADFDRLVDKKQESINSGDVIEVGFGFEYRVMQFASGFVKLDTDEVVKASMHCKRRLFIFDYSGTLSSTASLLTGDEAGNHYSSASVNTYVQDDGTSGDNATVGYSYGDDSSRSSRTYDPAGSNLRSNSSHVLMTGIDDDMLCYLDGHVRKPLSKEALENLCTIAEDPRNIVFVMSTGPRAELEAAFDAKIEGNRNVNLVADSGFYFKKARANNWECLYDSRDLDLSWMDDVKRLMQVYATRTNGAYVIVKDAAIVYNYRNSDPEYGEIQALELYEQLRNSVQKGVATVDRGKQSLHVHQYGVDKSVAVTLILKFLEENVSIPDFAMYIGDEVSDELAVKALEEYADQEPLLKHMYTCTVGKKPSNAQFYVDGVSDVLSVVHAIAVRHRLERHRHNHGHHPTSPRDFFVEFCRHHSLVSRPFLRALVDEATRANDTLVTSISSVPDENNSQPTDTPGTMSWSSWSTFTIGVAVGVAVGAIAVVVAPAGLRPLPQRLRRLWMR